MISLGLQNVILVWTIIVINTVGLLTSGITQAWGLL